MVTSQWRVLIVEDERDSIQMVSDLLRYHGCEVHVARNGRECLAALDELDPTLVIMDLAMAEMDGWETLAEIRANSRTAHIPVVAITAFHSIGVARDAIRAGFDAYHPKPLDPTTFVDHLVELVE